MGDLVEVAFVGDEFQAEMIRALLDDHGIPSMQQQVTPSGAQLGYGLMNPSGEARRVMVHPQRAYFWSFLAMAGFFGAWVLLREVGVI
jgi:hypothetical protein